MKESSPEDKSFPRFSLFFGILLCALFFDVISGTKSFFFRDFGLFGYPLAHYHRLSFWQGEWPLWNPYNNCGVPFLAQWNTLTLYPLSLVYLLLPLPWSLNLFCILHLYLAGLGMFLLARSWTQSSFAGAVAGLGYAFSGLTLSALMWPNNIAAMGLMPFVVLLADRAFEKGGRFTLGAAATAAVQVMSGAPEMILMTWVILGALALQKALSAAQRWKPLGRLIVIGLIAGGLTAAQLLPFLELLAHSDRSSTFGDSSWSMPPWGWANLLVPLFGCIQSPAGVFLQDGQGWTSSYYAGAAILLLASLAFLVRRDARTGVLTGLALFSLLMALGDAGYIFTLVRNLLPQSGFLRFPIKFVTLAVFLLPLLAGIAAGHLSRSPRPKLVLGFGVAAMVLLLALLGWAWKWPINSEPWLPVVRNGLGRFGFLAASVACLVWMGRSERARTQTWVQLGIASLIAADLLTHVPWQNPTVAPGILQPGWVQLKPQPKLGEGRAMLTRKAYDAMRRTMVGDPYKNQLCNRLAQFNNCNLLDEIPKVDGFYSLSLREEYQVRLELYNLTNQTTSPLADFLAVSQASSPETPLEWTPRPSALPVVTAGQKPIFADERETLARVSSPTFNPAREVFLPLNVRSKRIGPNGGRCQILRTRFTPHRVEVEVDSETESLVVVAQSYHPAWHALVDGTPTELWRANHAFQAVLSPAGKHVITFVYRDSTFRIGMVISIGLALIVICFALAPRRGG